MTTSLQDTSAPHNKPTHRLGRDDPLLQELWEIKASLNSAAKYSVACLAEEARRFDLAAELERIRNNSR